MAEITYIEFSGASQVVSVKNGRSVMEGAVKKGIPGIVAECGGSCACATCHVYVDDLWVSKVTPMSEMEREMLESAHDVKPNSRLSCQIVVNDALDGLVVRMPASQY